MITQAPRGTSDWFGDKMRTRTQVEAMARNLCEKFNIKEVITPVFEHTCCSSVVLERRPM